MKMRIRNMSGMNVRKLVCGAVMSLVATVAFASSVVYTYDSLGRLSKATYSNGVVITYSYDAAGNGTATTNAYSTQGALASMTQDLVGTAQDNSWSYNRNQVQEIATHSWSNDLYQWQGYTNGTRNYTANGLNQYTAAAGATISHDANGNLIGDGIWTYAYDADNRLKTANKTGLAATLAYDAAGRLRQSVIGATTTNLLYDGVDLVAEYDAASNLQRRYVHGPGVDEPIVWYEGATTTNKNWLYADHLGSVVATANAAGTSTATYTYGPFGEPNTTAGVRFRYTGQQYLGELGLSYYKARFYSPTLGRFLQTDPIGYADDMNLYGYVKANPINFNDPSGQLSAIPIPWHGIITYNAMRQTNHGILDSLTTAFGAWYYDFQKGSQSTGAANSHGMIIPGQSPEEARAGMAKFLATAPLSIASHTVVDGATPLHNGHEWNGWFKDGKWYNGFNDGVISHVIEDIFPTSETRANALQANIDLIRGRENQSVGSNNGSVSPGK